MMYSHKINIIYVKLKIIIDGFFYAVEVITVIGLLLYIRYYVIVRFL
jgi:uncharacterized membrane protein